MLDSIKGLARSTDSVAACLCGSLPPYSGGGEQVGDGEGQDVAQHDGREACHVRFEIVYICVTRSEGTGGSALYCCTSDEFVVRRRRRWRP